MPSYLPLPTPDNGNPSDPPPTRKKYTLALKAECVRQVAAGARQKDVVARAQHIIVHCPFLLDHPKFVKPLNSSCI